MSQEPTQDQPSDAPRATQRVLPGSRWLQRGFAGHSPQTVTVLRVGQRSVMVVIEGGKLSGHDRQKVGQRFNIVLDTFLKTHTLIEQPKGYRPGDEALPQPKKDTVETYFRRRRYAQEWVANMEGRNLRAVALDPLLPVVAEPTYQGDALIPAHAQQAQPTPPPQEEQMQNQPSYSDIEQRAQVEPPPEQPQPTQTIEAQRVTPLEADDEGPRRVAIVEYEEPPVEGRVVEEPDPLDVFLSAGRLAVEKLTRELDLVARDRDDHLAMAEALDGKYQFMKKNRDRIESAVLAAIAVVEGPEQPVGALAADLAEAEPVGRVVEEEPVVEGKPYDIVNVQEEIARREAPVEVHHQRPAEGPKHGPVAATQGTQRSWVLDYARDHGGVNVRNVVGDFVSAFGVSQEIAVKNIVSILGDQMKKPNRNWPTIERIDKGIYIVTPNQPS